MAKGYKKTDLQNLPVCAAEFIKLVVKKMRYRKKVRAEVMAELAVHFEDELKECATDEEKEQKARQLIEDFGDVQLLAVLLRRAKKRCRPLWRTITARTFQTTGILILCLIAYVVWFLSGKPVITTNYVAELNKIVRPVADESLNAAPFYQKSVELYEEKSSDETKELLGTKYDEATAEQKKLIGKWLNDNKEILDSLIAGTNKPYYWLKYEGEDMMSVVMPNLANFRRLTYSLRCRVWLSAEQGRYESTFDDIKSCYRLGQHLRGDKTLIEQLVGIAIEAVAVQTLRDILSEHQFDSAILAKLQQDFEQMISDEDFVVSFKAEKLFMYDVIQRCFTEDRLGGGHLYLGRLVSISESWSEVPEYSIPLIICRTILSPQTWPGAIKVLFIHPNKQESREMADRCYDFWERVACKSPAQIRAENIDIQKESLEIVKGNILLTMLAPALGRVIEISYRLPADVKSTLTIIAILRYRQQIGDYPENLDNLIEAGYLKELPMDPFSDKPLVYKKTDDDFILYSVGLNFEDDGGKYGKDKKGSPKLWVDNGDAVFWPVQKN